VSKTSRETFYISTPIYYVNDIPHIGHAYTTIIADALARFNRLRGKDVFFLTGTDEHGQKIERAAAEKGMTPLALANTVVGRIKDLWKALHISNDFFIRTIEPFHEKGVQRIFLRLKEKGDIYKGTYQGWYCVSEENFLPEDVPLQPEGDKICPDCGRRAALVSEECYFFRLSAFQEPLLKFYAENPHFVRPPGRMNEVVSFVRQGLKDLSITRTTVKWGIPVPDDPKHTIYVWFDALHNYLTGAGYDWDMKKFERYWPADIHLIGKDILRFHAIFWPAFLMAAGFPLPHTVYGHGWWLKDEAKMSKSKGNVLDPHVILRTFGPDPLRYFLLREIPIGVDGNFSHEGFLHRVNSDLANDLGNLVHRTLTMILGYQKGVVLAGDEEQEKDRAIREGFETLKDRVAELYEDCTLSKALEEIWGYISAVNKYLADNEPWKLAQDETQNKRLARILYQTAAAIRGISYLISPVMPESAQKIWGLLGETRPPAEEAYGSYRFENLKTGAKIQRPSPLFPRVALKDFLQEEVPPPPAMRAPQIKEETMDIVTFDEFKRMDLRVGEILKAERVPGTDKLLKLEVNIGTEMRTMVGGVGDVYAPEEMVGKKLIVIVNLKPAVIRGIESQAMLLAAEIGGKAIIPFFDRDIPAGAKVK
jgi:methionyl-tRNA synthetase